MRSGPNQIANHELGAYVEVNDEAWALLALFEEPGTVADAVVRGEIEPDEEPLFFELVARFEAHGILVPPDEARFLAGRGRALVEAYRATPSPASTGFFGAFGEEADADFHFLGVPFDHGSARAGAASGPAALRACSALVSSFPDPRTGRCRGVRDAADGALLLAGALLRDHGDVGFVFGEGVAERYQRIEGAVRALRADTKATGVPIFIGGDHAISAPILRALTDEPCFVVHFDAHGDLGPAHQGAPHHHGNVIARMCELEVVRGILQVGVRDFMPPWWTPPDKVVQLGAHRIRRMAPADVLALVPAGAPVYVTVDIDVLDPAEAPGTGTLLPGGLRVLELEELLAALGRERDILAADLVEVAPAPSDELTAIAATRCLLRLMDAIQHRRRAPP